MPAKPLISIVDDDESARASTLDLVCSMGFAAQAFRQPDDFVASGYIRRHLRLIADMRMPGMTGLELYSHLVASGHTIPIILITAFPDDRDRARARPSGARCYLAKPFEDKELFECIHAALGTGPPN